MSFAAPTREWSASRAPIRPMPTPDVPPCTSHRRGQHKWKVTVLVPTRVLGLIGPFVRIRCTRCRLEVDADVRNVIPSLLPHNRRAAHAAKRGTR